jgi:hypothetical protein
VCLGIKYARLTSPAWALVERAKQIPKLRAFLRYGCLREPIKIPVGASDR